jgi:hypothetical protein
MNKEDIRKAFEKASAEEKQQVEEHMDEFLHWADAAIKAISRPMDYKSVFRKFVVVEKLEEKDE